jgi:hypothetical protein
MTIDTKGNGWNEYKKLVEDGLSRGVQERKAMLEMLTQMKSDVAVACENRLSLREDVKEINVEVRKHSVEIAALLVQVTQLSTELKIKAGLWGALGAAIPSAIAVIFILVR